MFATSDVILYFVRKDDDYIKLKGLSNLYPKLVFIPLDYTSEKALMGMNLPFKNPDDFVSYLDYETIDDSAINIAESWHEMLAPALTYESINLGEIIEWELTLTIVSFLKDMHTVACALEVMQPNLVLVGDASSALKRIPHYVCQLKGIKTQTTDVAGANNDKYFKMDDIRMSFSIRNKIIEFNISRELFFKVKRIGETLAINTYKVLNRKSRSNTPVLLLDFNAITYYGILEVLAENNIGFTMLNSRRPAIWNLDSFRILLSLGPSIRALREFGRIDTENLESQVNQIIYEVEHSNIQSLFIFNNINFWSLIKHEFLQFCRTRFAEAMRIIHQGKEFLSNTNYSCVVTWTDELQFERIMVKLAAQRKIPSFVLQHGIFGSVEGDMRRWRQFNLSKLYADKILVYGKLSKLYLEKYNIENNRIEVIGSPRHDALSKMPAYSDNTILLATSGIPTNFSYFLSNAAIRKYEDNLRSICRVASGIKDKRFVVKLHPYAVEGADIQAVVREEAKNALILKNANTYRLLQECDLIISTESTVIMEGIILGKAAIVIQHLDYESVPFIKYGAALPIHRPEDAEDAIARALYDQTTREALNIGRKKFLEDYLSHLGNSSTQFLRIMRSYLN